MITRSKVVLVAEDEMLIRMSAAEALAEAGFEVMEADHADDALSLLNLHAIRIHVLFTDVHMPGTMSGLDLAHHVSRHWPWIGLLVASAHTQLLPHDLPAGGCFLPKPYDPEHMVGHVHRLVPPGGPDGALGVAP